MLYLIFYGLLAFAIYGKVLDAQRSDLDIYYGTIERNKMVKGKYGYHSDRKEWIWWGAIYGAVAIAPWIPGTTESWTNWAVSFVYLPLGGYHLNEYYRNKKKQLENRARQLTIVTALKNAIATGDQAEINLAFDMSSVNAYNPIATIDGRTAYLMFLWLYSDQPDLQVAKAECQQRIVEWIDHGAQFPA